MPSSLRCCLEYEVLGETGRMRFRATVNVNKSILFFSY
jgi:hypothetical protein